MESYDDVFNTLFDEEFGKIPYIFRFGKKRIKVVIPVLIAFALITVLLFCWLQDTSSVAVSPEDIGVSLLNYEYNPVLMTAVIIMFFVTLILGLWVIFAVAFEKEAFSRAASLAERIYFSEMNKRVANRNRVDTWK